jgi:hypothetical protein
MLRSVWPVLTIVDMLLLNTSYSRLQGLDGPVFAMIAVFAGDGPGAGRNEALLPLGVLCVCLWYPHIHLAS